MIHIADIYFLTLLNWSICVDFVSRGRESDFAANVGMVEIVSKRDERQAIVAVEGFFRFYFWGGVVECSGADYEPIIKVKIVRESGKGSGDGGPVEGDFFSFGFLIGITTLVVGALGAKGATSLALTLRSHRWWVERLAMGHELRMCPWRVR